MPVSFYSPFSPAYWRSAAREFSSLKILVFAALIAAMRIVVGMLIIPVGDNMRILFKYVPDSVGALVFGPFMGMCVGAAADILGYFIFPSGGFFPGYTLSAMLTYLIFALFFYRAEVTVLRITLARLCTNVLVNIGLGSLWSSIQYGQGYLYYLAKSVVKNLTLLPVEVIVILLVFRALLPVLAKQGFIPKQMRIPIWRRSGGG